MTAITTTQVKEMKAMTSKTTITTVTLKDACGRYLEHLKAIGKKPSTLGTTRRTLDLLIAEMGEEKEVGKILPLHVDKFFKSESATMQPGKDGLKPRAQASILQIRRIVRSALVYWQKQGYSKNVALPKNERKFLEPKAKKDKTAKAAKPKRTRKAKTKTEKPATAKADKKVKADKAWTGFREDEDTKAKIGETIAKMHFDKESK